MYKLNNKGMTLVEMILAILIFGIAALSLTTCFSASMNIINRATLFKNLSQTNADSIEIGKQQQPLTDEYQISSFKEEEIPSTDPLIVIYTKGGSETKNNLRVSGQCLTSTATCQSQSATLTYREFISDTTVDVPVDDTK